ncbi:outer membrane protein assembly factor BamB family protein [Haladaptatus sp. CMSO5]|uniref:outer membrane protein assembly factor BamB family protein n=1 Tax=Haladaptatus sp. CMSO5 TaxID=3120514 RepID=UPI002FCE59AD
MSNHSRRDVLKAAGIATGIGLSGYGLSTVENGTVRAAEAGTSGTWPMARNNAQGTRFNDDAVSPVTELETVWTWNGDEQGLEAPPIVDDDTVYVVEVIDDMDSGVTQLRALDADDGTERWSYESTFSRGPPAVAGDLVYHQTDTLAALDKADGSVRWEAPVYLGNDPILDGETLYVDGYDTEMETNVLRAYDRRSGDVQWEIETEYQPNTTLVVSNDTLYVPWEDGLRVHDAATGDEQTLIDQYGAVDTAAVYEGSLFLNSDDGLVALDEASREERWTLPGEYFEAIGEGLVFGNREADITAYDAETGEEVWAFEGISRNEGGEPTVANGAVYLTGLYPNGGPDNLLLLVLEATTGTVYSKTPVGNREAFATSAIPVDDRVYFGEHHIGWSVRGGKDLYVLEGPAAKNMHAIEIDSTPDLDSTDFDEGDSVTLDASGSVDPNGEIVKFEWDTTGDGEFNRSGPKIEMDLSYCGYQDVTVRTTDNDGDSFTKTIRISTK